MGSVQRFQGGFELAWTVGAKAAVLRYGRADRPATNRTLGNEEPSIVTVSVRPGVVDTAMQQAIRETGTFNC